MGHCVEVKEYVAYKYDCILSESVSSTIVSHGNKGDLLIALNFPGRLSGIGRINIDADRDNDEVQLHP